MIERFKEKLPQVLAEQTLIAHREDVARELAEIGELKYFPSGAELMKQDGTDNHLCFVLGGSVAIEINGKQVAERTRHQHVGEMAVIDPSAKRSATVRALEETVTLDVSESAFSSLAEKHPFLWRRLALELGSRLRERGKLLRKANDVPNVFIGSTVEALPIARSLQHAFTHEKWHVETWADATFKPGTTAIESLVASLERIDFSIQIVSPDDLTTSRGSETPSPRDNVVFELGLAYGALGRARTFMVRERGLAVKLPSDLLGVQAIEFKPGSTADLTARLAPVAHELRQLINSAGVRVG